MHEGAVRSGWAGWGQRKKGDSPKWHAMMIVANRNCRWARTYRYYRRRIFARNDVNMTETCLTL